MIRKYLQLNTIFRLPPNNNSMPSSLTKTLIYQITASPVRIGHPLYESYHRLTVNSRLSALLSQLQAIIANKEYHKKEKILEILMQTFSNMDVDTVAAKNLQKIIQMVSNLQKRGQGSMDSRLITKMKQKLNALRDIQQQAPKEILINFYMSQIYKKYYVEASVVGQELINHLNQSSKIDLKFQTITRFLQYIKKKSLSDYDRQIRIALLRKVKEESNIYSKEETQNLAFALNSLPHYDFEDEQLKIAEQIFARVEQSLDENDKGSLEIIQKFCRQEQYQSNKLSLSDLLANMIKSYIKTIKRYNSAGAHKIFQLITLANEKIIKAKAYDQMIQAFLLEYILISGKTKKHNKAVNQALQKLIPFFFSQSQLILLVQILAEIEFQMYPMVFYQLVNRDIDVTRLKVSFEAPNGHEKMLLAVAFNMNQSLSERKQAKQLKEKISKQLTQTTFRELYKQLLSTIRGSAFLKNFDKLFGQQVRKKIEQNLPNLSMPEEMSVLIEYFIFSYQRPNQQFQKLQEYIRKAPKEIIQNIISRFVNTKQKEKFGKLLYLHQSKQRRWDKTLMHLFTQANRCIRQGLLTQDEQTKYWSAIESFIKYFLYLPPQNEHMKEYSQFLSIIFRRYNSAYSDFLESGAFAQIFSSYLSPQFQKIQFFPQLRTIFTKYIIVNKDLPKLIDLQMSHFNLQELNFTEKKILKSMLRNSYTPKIDRIDQSVLPIMLYNKNLHNLLKSRSGECIQVIRNSKASALANYVVSMCTHAYQIYPQIACLIVSLLADKINFATPSMSAYLRAFIRAGLVLTPSCTEFMKCYLTYLTSSPNITEDYHNSLTTLTIIKSQHLPIDLTNSYIGRLLRKAGQYSGWQIRNICEKILLTNYMFCPEQLELVSKKAPAKCALIYLEEYWNKTQRERLLERILQQERQFDRLEIRYLNRIYPYQSNIYTVKKLQPINYITNNPQYQDKLKKLAQLANTEITILPLWQLKVYSIRGKIVMFISPFYRNSIHLISFIERGLQFFFKERTKLSILFGFPQSYKHVTQAVRPPKIFSQLQWRNFFSTITPTESSQQPQSKGIKQSTQNSQSVKRNYQIQFPDQEYEKETGGSNKKFMRRRHHLQAPNRQIL